MANCDVTKGLLSVGCKNKTAGLKNIFVANYSDEYDFDTVSDDVDGHLLKDMGKVSEVFKYPLKNTGNTFNEAIESSRDNGTTVYNGTLNFVIDSPGALRQFQVKMLSIGRPIIFVETNSGDFFVVGIENGVEVSGERVLEGELSGAYNYQLVGEASESQPAYFLDDDAVVELKALVASSNI